MSMLKRNNTVALLVAILLFSLSSQGCDIAPVKPEEAFVFYRDRMKNDQVSSARPMLSSESLNLVQKIDSTYHLNQPPENIAVLNALDPTNLPTPVKIEETQALLKVRTLKGANRVINLIRVDSKSKWKVDFADELRQLDNFLAARKTLDLMQEQAGEFAITWKAMDSQLNKINLPEPEKETQVQPKDSRKTPAKKPPKAQKKGPSNKED